MAMNKAEKARMAELEAALAAATVNESSYAAPKPMTRADIEAAKVKVKVPPGRRRWPNEHERSIALGYGFNDYIGHGSSCGTVFPMWSDGMYHGRGNHTGDQASQQMGAMYATEREAAIALRLALAKRFGESLAAADRLIEAAGV